MSWNILPSVSLNTSLVVAATSGILSHLLYFKRGYHVVNAPRIFLFYLGAEAVAYLTAIRIHGLRSGFAAAAALSTAYFAGLYSSMAVYRLFFHPLRRIPGPFAAKLTKFYGPWIARNSKMHDEHSRLQRKYGNFVRTGPNEVFIYSVDALLKIHGPGAKASKANTSYMSITYKGERNLDNLGSHEEHRWRRQIWDKALGTKAMSVYEGYALETIHEWLAKLETLQGRPINTSLYALLVMFDNMGRMGFSHKFNSVRAGKENHMLDLLESTFSAFAKTGQLAWPIVMLLSSGIRTDSSDFEDLAVKMVDERESIQQTDDILKYFLEDLSSDSPKSFHNRNVVYADAQAIMIAGTDTLASSFGYAMYYMARDPSVRSKLRAELAPLFGKTLPGEFVDRDLGETETPYLHAVLNESMRLNNPGTNGGPRSIPKGGLWIDGTFFPEGIEVFTPQYCIQRMSEYFEKPLEFIPERWTTRPELVIDKRAYIPFLSGAYSCPGRRIAITILRLFIANTVWHYDFQFAPGEDGTSIHREEKNQIILKAGKLECVFTKRE